jgi:translation initiation factor IF-2
VLLVTDVADLKANPACPAVGTVVEGKVDRSRGVLATLLVQNGTLRVGDNLVVGDLSGRVRAMFDDKGSQVDAAPPSMPVAVLGLPDVPAAGEIFEVVESEREARIKAEERSLTRRAAAAQPAARILSLDDISRQIKAGQAKELNVILKADVQGSIEPIVKSLETLGDEDLRVKILHSGIGSVSESDIMLAVASQAIVVGFAVDPDSAARRMAEQEGVDVRRYDIIYKLIEDLDKALKGLLEPQYADVVMGHAEVRATFRIPRVGTVAGCYVTDGNISRDARARVLRDGTQIFENTLHSLKRFTEDVKDVATGYECGVGINNFNDFVVGDILEFYKKERVS